MNKAYPCPYYMNMPMNNSKPVQGCHMFPCPYCYHADYPMQPLHPYSPFMEEEKYDDAVKIKDYGPKPFVVDIEEVTKQNDTFRTALWTGRHLQLTLMSINPGEDIGLEIHPDVDQFIRIEEGQGLVKMGDRKDKLDFQEKFYEDFAVIIPAGKWHNLINTGNKPLKLYSIYAPPQHPKGTVHETKAIAEAAEEHHSR